MSDFKLVSILNPQTQYINVSGILDVSLSGNTDGVLANISTGTIILAGGNNITLSQDGQSVSIIGGAGGGGGGGVAIAAGTQTATTNTVVFSNSNNVTFGMAGSTRVTASASFPAQTNQTVGLYASSNTYLTSSGTVDARSLSFRGDKSITVGVSAGEVLFSVGAYLTTAMASNAATISNINVSAGTTSNLLSKLTFADGNGVSFGLDGSTITASVAAAGGAQTGISGIVASDTTYTSGTVSFSNQNGVTIGSSVNGATQYIRLSVATNYQSQGAYLTTAALSGDTTKYVQNWKLTGNTAGTTSSAQGTDLWFSGGNSITVSGNSNSIVFSVGAYLTTALGSGASTQFVQANAGFNGTNASGTIASNSISVSVAAPIPIGTAAKAVASVGSTGTITRYAPEDHQHAGVAAFAVTNTGNTLGNTRSQVGTLFIAASGGITASQSTAAAGNDTIWLSVAAPIAQTNQTLGLYATSNTEGASSSSTFNATSLLFQGKGAASVGFSNGSIVIDAPSAAAGNVTFSAGAASAGLASIVFSNSNGVSFGLNGSTITASAAGGGGGIGGGVSTGGNTAGSTGTVTTGNIIFVGSHAISLSQSTGAAGSAATITIDSPATSSMVASNGISISTNGATISIYPAPMSATFNMNAVTVAATRQGNSSVSICPFDIDWPVVISQARVGVSVALASTSNTSSASQAYSLTVVLYTRNGSTLNSVWSGSNASNSFWQSNSTTVLAGARGFVAIGAATTLYPDRYWAAVHLSTTNTGTGGNTTALAASYSMMVGIAQATAALGMDPWDGGATAQSRALSHGLGIYSTNASLASIALTDAKLTQTGNTATLGNVMINLRNWTLY